jgi:hypothetical protein
MSSRLLATAAIVAAMVVAGCGTAGASASPSAADSAPPASAPGSAPVPSSAGSGLPAGAWEAILADLETRIGVDVSSATIVSVEDATWPDGAMGCPKPGEMYIQAIVEGQVVIVAFDGNQYDFRVSDQGVIRFCGEAS